MEKYIAYCGLVCSECPVYTATQNQDEDLKEQLAKEYSTEDCKFEKEDMNCAGCHAPKGANEKMCAECPMRKCGSGKGISHCAACGEYPCEHIESYVPSGAPNRSVLDGLFQG